MNKSETIKNLAKALATFQAEIKNPTNSAKNPYFNSKYAPLNEILNETRPILSKHGISLIQNASSDGVNSTITITTLIMHESGEWIESDPLILKTDKNTAQGAGSAITYARRYALSAILGIASEDDDDGNSASGNYSNTSQQKSPSNTNKRTAKTTSSNEIITISQAQALFKMSDSIEDIVRKVILKHGYDSTKKIKTCDYENIKNEIELEIFKSKKGA